MRIPSNMAHWFGQYIRQLIPGAEVYLFGSRADDIQRGGDIDILILSSEKIPLTTLVNIRFEFEKTFGEQKIDLINFTFSEEDSFKSLILPKAILL